MTATPEAVARAVAAAHREEWTRVMATTLLVTRSIDLAEESVQEAYAAALQQWPGDGLPARPGAWLTTAARRRALDAIRREATLRSKLPLLVWRDAAETVDTADERIADEPRAIVLDEQLRLVFLCCHPALGPDARVALTLRLVCGVPTADIAAAFLVPVATMAARLTRAKRKIAIGRIPCAVPEPAELDERLGGVLDVISVLLATGHAPPSGSEGQRIDLVDQALRLAETVRTLLPDEPETAGALAQTLLVRARTSTRTDADGHPVPLPDQDRKRWDRGAIERAHDLIIGVLETGGRGPTLLRAAIASLVCRPGRWSEIDWPEVVQIYDALLQVDPSPVAALNRAVAVAEVRGPELGLRLVEGIEQDGALASYRYLHATKAHLLRQLGRDDEAREATLVALRHTGNVAEREVLMERLLW